MKNSVKKLFKGLLIVTVTLLSGFGITAISFNLFGTLTSNEMKLFFAIDVIVLFTVGTVFFLIDESNKKKKRRKEQFEKRHAQRVEKYFREYNGIDMVKVVASSNNNAA